MSVLDVNLQITCEFQIGDEDGFPTSLKWSVPCVGPYNCNFLLLGMVRNWL